jgi:acyl dehydratase
MILRYFEDMEIGARADLGTYTFTEDAIVEFARRYDPQPFHIDRAAAAKSVFGGIIASGWHTLAVFMKLAVASRDTGPPEQRRATAGISPGFEDLQWLKPVRPGMTLRYSTEIIGKVELKSRPEWGLVKTRVEARDADGSLMMRFTGKGFVQRRPK